MSTDAYAARVQATAERYVQALGERAEEQARTNRVRALAGYDGGDGFSPDFWLDVARCIRSLQEAA